MNYPALAERVTNLFTRYGGDATITRTVMGTYSTLTHTYTSSTTSTPCKCVSRQFIKSIMPGSLAGETDEDFLVPPTVRIEQNDKLTFNSVDYYVDRAQPVAPGGTILMYKVWTKG